MRTYGMNFADAMGMPIRAFWLVSGMVPRLLAHEMSDQLELDVLAAHDPQAAFDRLNKMREFNPAPVIFSSTLREQDLDVERDEDGIADLRKMLTEEH